MTVLFFSGVEIPGRGKIYNLNKNGLETIDDDFKTSNGETNSNK